MTVERASLWTRDAVLAATGGRATGGDWHASGISIDSRTVQAGDLFVAVQGETHDGHAFVEAAFARGACAALVSDSRIAATSGPAIRVEDALKAVTRLGEAGRARSNARIAAITGSVGKTSTKEALRHVLSAQAPTSASAASFNNHIGVPVSLARLPPQARYGVFEIGMNHPGEIAPLALQVRPHVATIVEVAPVHIEYFDSVEAIAREKSEIFVGMRAGIAVLNRDNPHFAEMARQARGHGAATVIGFGGDPAAELRMIACRSDAEGSDVTANWQGRELRYRVGAAGLHWAKNSLAVLATVAALGADIDAAAAALASVTAVTGRGARRKLHIAGGTVDLIDESYNASPTSVRAMLQVLKATPRRPGGRRLLVLGDMRELGEHSVAMHRDLLPDVIAGDIDQVFACGPFMRHLFEGLPAAMRAAHTADSAALVAPLLASLRDGDTLAVKGSLGSKMKIVIDALSALDRARAEAA